MVGVVSMLLQCHHRYRWRQGTRLSCSVPHQQLLLPGKRLWGLEGGREGGRREGHHNILYLCLGSNFMASDPFSGGIYVFKVSYLWTCYLYV